MRSLHRRRALRALALLGLGVACWCVVAAAPAGAARTPTATPVTPSGWRITPAGHSITVDDGPGLAGPWGVTIAPDGRRALVTSSGQAAQIESTEVFDIGNLSRVDIEPYD